LLRLSSFARPEIQLPTKSRESLDDFESQQRFAEIRLRACQRIGEISRDLEKVKPGGSGGGSKATSLSPSKTETLELARIGSTAAVKSVS
jgi:hypothetical protein